MYFPGFDPKCLTNEELFEKQMELSTKKIMAARFGKTDVVNQIHMMIQAIDTERRERIFVDRIGSAMMAASSVAVESDPSLRETAIEPKPDQQKPAANGRQVHRRMRTAQPVTPQTSDRE